VPVGLSGIAARSGLVPSAFVGAVSGGYPFESAAGVVSDVSSPIRSEIVEQPAVHAAIVRTAARRTKVLVMLVFLSLFKRLAPPYTGAPYPFQAEVPAKAVKSCDK
jgi:hypothetical protein